MTSPPLALAAARLIAYAATDGLECNDVAPLYVGANRLHRVPHLAVCQPLDAEDFLLFHCDDSWNVLAATSSAATIEQVKSAAERRYPGVRSRWTDINVSKQLAVEYLRNSNPETACSFCGRAPFEVTSMVERDHARICSACIREFYGWLQTDGR